MDTPAPIISTDLEKELKRLAAILVADDATFDAAHAMFVSAGSQLGSTAAEFAKVLYDFTCRYADHPALIDSKLDELGISSHSPSVYQRISRLAFNDVKDKDSKAIRQKVWRYGTLIERAHVQGTPPDVFESLVKRSIAFAMQKLGAAPVAKEDAIEHGRREARKLFADQQVTIRSFTPPPTLGLGEGDDVQLLAKYEGGKLVVYGLVPPNLGNVPTVLTKIGAPLVSTKKRPLALIADLIRTLKLVTSDKDDTSEATYSVASGRVHFTVSATGAVAILAAPATADFLAGHSATLTVAGWGRLFGTLAPLSSVAESVEFDGKTLVVSVDPSSIPDLGHWFQEKKKPIRVGKATDASLHIPLTSHGPVSLAAQKSPWRDSVTVDAVGIAPLMQYKPEKAISTFVLSSGQLSPTSNTKPVADRVNLKKPQLRLVKSVCRKFLRHAPEITLDQNDRYLRISSINDADVLLTVLIELE